MHSTLHRSTSLRFLAVALAGLSLLSGCGTSMHIAPPPGFAVLDGGEDHAYRAVSPDGVVLAVRREKNEPHGDLGFWSGAIDAKLRRDGYRAFEGHEVVAKGVRGKQIRYAIERAGREHTYWVTVFVTEKHVLTAEAGGDHELFARESQALARALETLDVE